MAELVRRCENCGYVEPTPTWKSLDQATEQGVFEKVWTCPRCTWTEFDLVEAGEAAVSGTESETPAGIVPR